MQIEPIENRLTILLHLSEEEKKTLITKLNIGGFEFVPLRGKYGRKFRDLNLGHVYARNPEKEHPRLGKYPLPVGFIGKDYAELINLDEKFPEDYHTKLVDICNSIGL